MVRKESAAIRAKISGIDTFDFFEGICSEKFIVRVESKMIKADRGSIKLFFACQNDIQEELNKE